MAVAAGTSPISLPLAPILQWKVAGHHRGTKFMAAHDDFKQELAALVAKRILNRVGAQQIAVKRVGTSKD